MKSFPSFEIKIVLLKVHKEHRLTMILFEKLTNDLKTHGKDT